MFQTISCSKESNRVMKQPVGHLPILVTALKIYLTPPNETTQCNLTESVAEEVRKSYEIGATYEGISCTVKVTKRKN